MRLECEKLEECEATPELIRELVRNGAKRGEFMIMESQLRVGDGSWIWLVRWSESREEQLKPRQEAPLHRSSGVCTCLCVPRGLSVEAVRSADGLLHQVLHLLGQAQGFRRQHTLVRTCSAALVCLREQLRE